jgi:hypothetical protein
MRWARHPTDFEDGLKDRKQREARHQRDEADDGQSDKRTLDAVHLADPRFLRFILTSGTTAALTYVNRRQQIALPRWRRGNALFRLVTRTNGRLPSLVLRGTNP